MFSKYFIKWKSGLYTFRTRTALRNQLLFYFWLRRNYQSYNLRQHFLSFKRNALPRNKFLSLASAVPLFLEFDWNRKRIELDNEIRKSFFEFEYVEHLIKRKPIEKITAACTTAEKTSSSSFDDLNAWEFYVEKDNMITWRQEKEPGQYIYKVYVKYDDITAEDFVSVQMDLNYRLKWDSTAIKLEVVDNDPFDNQQVIYWEMLWPKLFSNRDYVFVRKCFVDRKRNIILICCKSIEHPKCPQKNNLHRVQDYWSFMVIKPTTSFNQKGFEFVLTYFDNPGIKIPKYITNYVAQRQLPDFIKHLYDATIKYAEKKLQDSYKKKDPGFEYPADIRLDDFEDDNGDETMEDNVNQMKKNELNLNEKEVEEETTRKSWWSYFIPFNLV